MVIDGSKLIQALEALELSRGTDPAALMEQAEGDPTAALVARLVQKVAALAAEVTEARKAARQVAEAEARWAVVGVARGEVLFQDGRGHSYTIPGDLARAITDGVNLDADVTFEERDGFPFTIFEYADRDVAIPSSLLRALAPTRVTGEGSPTPTGPTGIPGLGLAQTPPASSRAPAPGDTG